MNEYSKMVTDIAAQVVDESAMHDADKAVISARLRGMQETIDNMKAALDAHREAVRVAADVIKAWERGHLFRATVKGKIETCWTDDGWLAKDTMEKTAILAAAIKEQSR